MGGNGAGTLAGIEGAAAWPGGGSPSGAVRKLGGSAGSFGRTDPSTPEPESTMITDPKNLIQYKQ